MIEDRRAFCRFNVMRAGRIMSSPPGLSAFQCVTSSFMDDRQPVTRSVFVAFSGSVAVLPERGITARVGA